MTRWPRRLPPAEPIEAPAWARSFDAEAWRDDEADAPYLAGLLEHGLDERWRAARDWHSANRWNKARLAWFDAHPAARHPVEELLEELGAQRARRRAGQ